MAASNSPKLKADRKRIIWVFFLGMVGLVVYLFIAKGPDLGQGAVNAKKEAAAKAAEKDRYAARVQDPAASSSAQFTAAKMEVAGKAQKESDLGGAVPPPGMGPDLANQVTPPPPSMNGSVDDLQMSRLDRAHDAANAAPGSSGAVPTPGFIVYTAGVDTSGKGGARLPGVGNTASSGNNDQSEFDSAYAKEDPKNSEELKKDRSAMQALEDAQLAQKADKVQAPGENNQRWLFEKQNSKVDPAKSIMATRSTGLYWLAPGTIVNAVMLNAVDTRLPGQIAARVTQPIYDSRYGRYLVIPAGSTLEGSYNSSVADGQERVLMAFDTMVTPAGGIVPLGNMSAGDALGRAGIAGTLHTHFWKRMGIATLMAAEAIGMDRLSNKTVIQSGNGQSGPPPISSGGQIMVDAANQELKQRFSLGPNITIPAGAPMSIITTGGIEVPPVANSR